jgi:hypothetical protein
LDFFAATSSSSIGAGDNGGVIGMPSSPLHNLFVDIWLFFIRLLVMVINQNGGSIYKIKNHFYLMYKYQKI